VVFFCASDRGKYLVTFFFPPGPGAEPLRSTTSSNDWSPTLFESLFVFSFFPLSILLGLWVVGCTNKQKYSHTTRGDLPKQTHRWIVFLTQWDPTAGVCLDGLQFLLFFLSGISFFFFFFCFWPLIGEQGVFFSPSLRVRGVTSAFTIWDNQNQNGRGGGCLLWLYNLTHKFARTYKAPATNSFVCFYCVLSILLLPSFFFFITNNQFLWWWEPPLSPPR